MKSAAVARETSWHALERKYKSNKAFAEIIDAAESAVMAAAKCGKRKCEINVSPPEYLESDFFSKNDVVEYLKTHGYSIEPERPPIPKYVIVKW